MYYLKNNLLLILMLALISCNRMDYFDEVNNPIIPETKVLVHGAVGNTDEFRRNTLEGAIFGLDKLDGIEIDIAISKDNGLWLAHDRKVISIDKYFINTTDHEIANIKDDNGDPYYTKLEDVLIYLSTLEQKKHLSLDVKYPIKLFTGKTFKEAAEKIIALSIKYNLEKYIYVESDAIGLLKEVNKQNDIIETYFLCLGDFEKCLGITYQNNLNGISFDYGREDELTTEGVTLAHNLGIKILVYTINDVEINEVYPLNVDIIQTDDIDFYEQLTSD